MKKCFVQADVVHFKKLMEDFIERIDGRDNTPYNLTASTEITLHSQLNNKNLHGLVTVG